MLVGLEQSEQLSKWPKRRIKIEATVSRDGDFYDAAARTNVPSFLLSNLEVREPEDSEVIGKVWCSYAAMFRKAGVRVGDLIRCTVQTYQFSKRDRDDPNKSQLVWGIREPREVQCLNRLLEDLDQPREPMPRIPAAMNGTPPPAQLDPPPPAVEVLAVEAAPVAPPPPATATDPRRELFFALDDLVAAHGLPLVRKVLAAVEAVRGE